jgi:hypothetical protein
MPAHSFGAARDANAHRGEQTAPVLDAYSLPKSDFPTFDAAKNIDDAVSETVVA